MERVGERGGDGIHQNAKPRLWSGRSLATAAFCAVLLVAPNFGHDSRIPHPRIRKPFRTDKPTPLTQSPDIALGGSHERVVEAVRLAKQYPDAKLVVTGASPQDQAYAQAQGLTEGRLVIEPHAKTTYENALFSRQMLAPDRHEKWLIVTSAIHMPRAVGAFRGAGFSVVPWPVFDQPVIDTEVTPMTLHEVFGLLYYWLLGRIDSLFPAPNA